MNEEYFECYDCQAVVPSSRFYFCASCGLGFCTMCGVFVKNIFFCDDCYSDEYSGDIKKAGKNE